MYNYQSKLVDSSRMLADLLVKDIGNNSHKFAEMMGLAFRDEYPVSMRAARIIALSAEQHIDLIHPYLLQMIEALEKCKVDGVKRSFLKILAEQPVNLDEGLIGKLTDLAFTWVNDPRQAIAVRYYCIDIILNVATCYPEIGIELSELLRNMMNDFSSGLQSKSKKVIKYLKKMGV
jgi:hypothetical protein